MKEGTNLMIGLALAGVVLVGCGEMQMPRNESVGIGNLDGSSIKELSTNRKVVDDFEQAKLSELAGKQVFFKNEKQGGKSLAVSFYKDGTWMDDLGYSGKYTVQGKTLTVTDETGLGKPHVFAKDPITPGDTVDVPFGTFTNQVTVTRIAEAADPEELAAAAQPPKEAEPVDEPDEIDGYRVVGFDDLSGFKYDVPDEPASDPKAKAVLENNVIPKNVRALDDKKIAVRGYMLPLRVEEGLITEFLVLRDQSACCFGAVPRINEWISVRMPKGKGVKPVMDVPIYFFGKFKVGAVLENDYLVGIYEMDGDKIGGPL
jgi:hypothetical protein